MATVTETLVESPEDFYQFLALRLLRLEADNVQDIEAPEDADEELKAQKEINAANKKQLEELLPTVKQRVQALCYFINTVQTEAKEVENPLVTGVSKVDQNSVSHSTDPIAVLDALIAFLDTKLSDQLNEIIHADEFQKLESTWRGMKHLVSNTETDPESLKIKFLNIPEKELGKTLQKYSGTAFDQSPIFKKVYEFEFGIWGGEPFGCLIGDYEFDNTKPKRDMLEGMAKIAACAHSPFIAGVSPKLMGMQTWQELPDPVALAGKFALPELSPWNSLRKKEDVRYVGLTLPRFLGRQPYDPEENPVEEFHFVETLDGQHHNYLWVNAAYAMGVNINQAFKFYGWCSRIRGINSGGLVTGLPLHTFKTTDGSTDIKVPTEVDLPERRGHEISNLGFIPLTHEKNTDNAAFFSANSMQKPVEYDDDDATSNAKLSMRLPYLFASCRFAHYLKCMTIEKIGEYTSRAKLEEELNNWIRQYVLFDLANATQINMAQKPLAEAEVVVEDVPGDPGYYRAKFSLRPHYQLEGLTATLTLVSKLPSQKAG